MLKPASVSLTTSVPSGAIVKTSTPVPLRSLSNAIRELSGAQALLMLLAPGAAVSCSAAVRSGLAVQICSKPSAS